MKYYVVDAFADHVFEGNPAGVCVLESEQQVVDANPDDEKVKKLDGLLFHITARGSDFDCVTRSFAPQTECQRRSGLRFRPLSRDPDLVEAAGEKQAHRQTGFTPRRHFALRNASGSYHLVRKSRALCHCRTIHLRCSFETSA